MTPRLAFTLMETIAAIVILALAVPPVLYALKEGHALRAGPVLSSKARWLAQEKLDDVIADRHSTTRGYAWVINANYPAEIPVAGVTGFTRSVSITETAADLVGVGAACKQIAVAVAWTDAAGAARTLTLKSVVADY